MDRLSQQEALDRHALATAIWLSSGFVALILASYGFKGGGAWFLLAAFGSLLAGFAGHVIVNAVYRAIFTAGEIALGLVAYCAGLAIFGGAVLLSEMDSRDVVPLCLGFLALFAAAVLYMVTRFGLRRAFDAFDVVRDFGFRAEARTSEARKSR